MYPSTTWELLTSDKYIRTGSTALQQGGSNSITIQKINLPNTKLQVETFSLTRGTMNIIGHVGMVGSGDAALYMGTSGALVKTPAKKELQIMHAAGGNLSGQGSGFDLDASRNWSGSTSSASPYTSALGNGTAITIQPSYITLKFWKRLT